jgi:cytochrome c-type biogenesis protein CcmE
VNPTRKRRLALIGLVLAAAALAATFIALALQENLSYLHTPTEVLAGKAPTARFRLGGVVCSGSVRRTDGTLDVAFRVTDGVRNLPVRYHGILPDMFREGTSIVATGRMERGAFAASEVLAKHDETYMPPEVAKGMSPEMLAKMEGGDAKHSLTCGAD